MHKPFGKGWKITTLLTSLVVVFLCLLSSSAFAAQEHVVAPLRQLLMMILLLSLLAGGVFAAAWRGCSRDLALSISLAQDERCRRAVEEKNVQLSKEIAEHKRAEAAVGETEGRYRKYFDDDLSGFFVTTAEGRILACNSALAGLLGFSSATAALQEDLFSFYRNPRDREVFLHLLKERKALKHYAVELRGLDGQAISTIQNAVGTFDENGNLTEIRGFVIDHTEQKKLEEQLLHSQKMEAIGTLAGGIAHDFNNILTAIMGNAEMGLLRVPVGNDERHNFAEILKATKRARDLVKQILTFSRQERQQPRPLQISAIVKEVLKLLRATLPSTIEIRSSIESNAGIVLADPIQIHQLVMNLCTNAAHAMQKSGGVMGVALRSVFVGASRECQQGGLDPGRYVELTVSDNGHGMDAAVAARIFDPFFTTKPVGEGSGMGLAVVHGIVQGLGGDVKVETAMGKGSTFHVFLPMSAEDDLQEAEGAEPAAEEDKQGRILLVDDEDILLSIGKQMLERLGYRVTSMKSSIEALECFQRQPQDFDLVITDQTMPKLTGSDLAAALTNIRSDIPIILCSGYVVPLDEEQMKEIGIKALVQKPFVFRELADIAGKVMTP